MSTRPAEHRAFPFAQNGAKIRSARRRKGESQERFAAEIGTTRRHMIRLENGEHLPSSGLRDRIAKAGGIEASSLQAADEDEESEMPTDRDLLEALYGALGNALEKTEPTASLAKATADSNHHGG